MVVLKRLQWVILASLAILLYFLLKPARPEALDIVFVFYSLLAASFLVGGIDLVNLLLVALPHALYSQHSLTAFVIAFGVLTRIGKVGVKRRLSQALFCFVTFGYSLFITSLFVDSYLRLISFALLTLLLQIPIGYLSKEPLKLRFDQIIFAGFFGLITAILANLKYPSALTLSLYPLGQFLYLNGLSTVRRLKIYELQHERFEQFRKKLALLAELTSSVSQKGTIQQSLSETAGTISEISGFKYVLINILNKESGKVVRIAHHGISQQEFERLRSNPPPVDYIYRFMQERFRVSNSFFVPDGALELPAEYTAIFLDSKSVFEEPDAWKPNDMLIIPIYSPSQDLVGYISVDAPVHGKRPTLEDIRIIELIANQIYRLLERSEIYQSIVVRQPYDQHTLLLTHSAFLGELENQCEKGEPFAVVILDIDDLSKINSQYGHEVGDRIIEKIADTLKAKTRKSDLAARYGGEEFALLLRNVSKSKAVEITDRILDEIRKIQDVVNVTTSAGIGVFPDHGLDYNSILKQALKALEIAKKSGKDRLMMF
ncbi:MAG: GGDEF domain-containing protein [Pseudothermotoga sp.]